MQLDNNEISVPGTQVLWNPVANNRIPITNSRYGVVVPHVGYFNHPAGFAMQKEYHATCSHLITTGNSMIRRT